MVNYQKLYAQMFNAATDALAALEAQNIGQAKDLLRRAQITAERQYVKDGETEDETL